ncbi:MAG TPA: Hpt domain-containing protein, partial [Aquabacterium sp.]|nr:Hpt domain-containing protein [Aquabacterium sp.]
MSQAPSDDDLIQEMLPAVIEEAHEQSASLEQLLLQLELTPDDSELLNALFRCAHTIKGSAGVFGLDRVVSFTHHVEALLQPMREGHLSLTPALSTLLLQSNDVIRALVNEAGNAPDDDPDTVQTREALVARLKQATAEATGATPSPAKCQTEPAVGVDADTGMRSWQISVRFTADTFRHGIDPLTLLNYVGGLGAMPCALCDAPSIPPLEALDPEDCHLAIEFQLDTTATREEIEQSFKFAREDCELIILEPGASPKDLVAIIDALPDQPRLGDILVSA